jgi:AcrR family transcriptional regulator
MARLRSPEKRNAILQATAHEIAEAGLGAPIAKIAQRAGLAEGTLFTYFINKDELLNELYLELKNEVYDKINADFPHKGSLQRRAWHIWAGYLDWAIAFPAKRKATMQLHVSDVITPETHLRTVTKRGEIDATLQELEKSTGLRGLPSGFAAATMAAMQEAAMDFITKAPKQREELIKRTFKVVWRALG